MGDVQGIDAARQVPQYQQWSNSTAAWMIVGGAVDTLVNVELGVGLLTHGCGMDKELECHMLTAPEK